MVDLSQLMARHWKELNDYFHQTKTTAIVWLDKNLNIFEYNPYFSTLVSAGEDLAGKPIYPFLLPESQEMLPLSDDEEDQPIWLNFKSPALSAVPLQCHVYKQENGEHLIVGGHLRLSNEDIFQKMTEMSNEMVNMTRDLNRKIRELKETYSKIKVLNGMLPICMHCKEIRDDQGYWSQLEKFITENSEASFSHSLCPECAEKYYPDMNLLEEVERPKSSR